MNSEETKNNKQINWKQYLDKKYWKFYADGNVEGKYRVVVKYFIETSKGGCLCAELPLLRCV